MPYHGFNNLQNHVTCLHQASAVIAKLRDVNVERWLCGCRVPEECPAEIAQLYQACLSELPAQRPKAADLVRIIACADTDAHAGAESARSASLAGRKSLRWLSRQRQQ